VLPTELIRFIAGFSVISFVLLCAADMPQTTSGSGGQNSDAGHVKTEMSDKAGHPITACPYPPAPAYTKEAKEAKYEGTVMVEGIIMTDGRVTNLRVVKSPGLGLDESIISALKTWKCEPVIHDGKPVPAKVPFAITFRLKQKN